MVVIRIEIDKDKDLRRNKEVWILVRNEGFWGDEGKESY